MTVSRFAEGLAFFCIFPFVNEMIATVGGVPETEVGFWSGWIESSFIFVSMIVMLFWGRASDNFGRKPVLVTCLTGMAVSAALSGVAQNVFPLARVIAKVGSTKQRRAFV